MGKLLRTLLALAVCSLVLFIGRGAEASCHQFLVTADASVKEGDKVNVRVQRDDNTQDSSVNLRTADGSAIAGADYKSTIKRISFTGDEVSKTLEIPTVENNKEEPSESFSIKLSGGQGCPSEGGQFDYGQPAKVTIKDDDFDTRTAPPATQAPTATPRVSPAKTAKPAATATATPTEEPTPEPEPTPTETPFALPTEAPDDDDDINPVLVGLAVGAFVLAAGSALALARYRRRATS